MNNGEHLEQRSLIKWCQYMEPIYTELKWIFAIPNGGKRNIKTAMKLKAEGVKPGVSDLCLPVSRGEYHGLFIEMKYGKGKLTPSQIEFKEYLTSQRYCFYASWSWIDATKAIERYLNLTKEKTIRQKTQERQP